MNADNQKLLAQWKALADPVRLRLVSLCATGECAVSELTGITGLSQPRVSQHLKALCDAGLLQRFRDGQFVFYRTATRGRDGSVLRQLLGQVTDDEVLSADRAVLKSIRTADDGGDVGLEDRELYRHLVELSVAAPLGELLDIGSGRGDLLKLLASRARRVVGVDIDPDARRRARAKLVTAGILNCTLRQGDMYHLPWSVGAFDTVILDDVLVAADRPVDALREAERTLRTGGRLIVVSRISPEAGTDLVHELPRWCASADLRLSAPKLIPANKPRWLLAVATRLAQTDAAA